MKRRSTVTVLGAEEEAATLPEHDYAHSVANESASPEVAPAANEVEKAVGAEVDCPALTPATRAGRRRLNPPEDESCASCMIAFERHGRSFNRRAVFTFTTPETVHWVFQGSEVHDKSFMCETCAKVLRGKCRRKQTGKRSLWLQAPAPTQSQMGDKKKVFRMGKKSKAAQLVSKSCYKAAFKMLWSAKGARRPMLEFWSKQLKVEMKALTRQADNPFHQKVSSRKPLSSFPWRRCLNWVQDKAPLVSTCLTSLFPDINAIAKSSHQISEDQAQTLLMRRAVVALSIPLFTRNIWRNNFLQAALGAELRLQGCSGSALDALNTMGLCQNKDTVRLLLHRLRSGKRTSTLNGQQSQMIGVEGDIEEGEEEEEDEEEEEEEEVDDDDDEEEEEQEAEQKDNEEEEEEEEQEEENNEMEMARVEEVEEEEVQDGLQNEEEEDQEVKEKLEMEQKRREKKKAKKEKRKERGKQKLEEEEEDHEMAVEELEVKAEEVPDGLQEDEDQAVKEELEIEERKKKKKKKKKEKRKERGNRRVEGEEDEEPEQKKSKVVVVRLGLLKGHSEVGRSDLSAP
ncbi:uncharacterized protein LOC117731282 [Cyclopterus lumpus]|uniref:uncharacterized protein LOC117731282 n=1 Tax=Cyclopterus lumpus TaxID=8103 RepID=UPI0014863E22|nr:uncharacterized protein LOC117731282 [Cyclopterus lumpus]